ncbi:MAG: 2-oxoacid:acceptor oxidoreductase subunit alpha [Methanomicrobiales archaeon]|nr:2-oxoacid:acceptor oxidoreductase subunit alpha [Methanomicrobiales archaeon]
MNDFSVLIGGKAGEGLNKAGQILAHLMGRLGYRVYMYYDYPSLIRGGHNFSVIRGSEQKIAGHRAGMDIVLALNQDTVDFHRDKILPGGLLIYDAYYAKGEGMAIPLKQIIEQNKAPSITANSGIIGAFCKAVGIEWGILEEVLHRDIPPKVLEINLAVARGGFDAAQEHQKLHDLGRSALPFITGNEAIGLGLIQGGLTTWVAYPMTPSSSLLHFLAEMSDKVGLKVIHPENEIAVMNMALGFAAAGERVGVGTSGGGFCLMSEGLSLAGMSETPIVIMMGQRTGPSTGLPTYTGQTEYHFLRHAGQGEFSRFIVAPGDANEAFYWSTVALNLAWKFQIPAFILTDKTLSEGGYSFTIDEIRKVPVEDSPRWDGTLPYRRYAFTESGVSPLTEYGREKAVVKVNGYYHDPRGITTEDPGIVAPMQEKLLRKLQGLDQELVSYDTVNQSGSSGAVVALVCWGSNKGVCQEVAEHLGLRMVQPVVLWPFPVDSLRRALEGTSRVILVENNATGQLAAMMRQYGFAVHEQIHKYDGRPFTVEELENRVKGVLP